MRRMGFRWTGTAGRTCKVFFFLFYFLCTSLQNLIRTAMALQEAAVKKGHRRVLVKLSPFFDLNLYLPPSCFVTHPPTLLTFQRV